MAALLPSLVVQSIVRASLAEGSSQVALREKMEEL
jgi:hypothetical protein